MLLIIEDYNLNYEIYCLANISHNQNCKLPELLTSTIGR